MSNISVKTEKLTRRFGSFTAVDAVSIEVQQGEIFGFLGANGAGKTTMIRMLCGLLSPTEGNGTVAGFDIYRESEQIKKNIGYMSQKFSLYDDLTIAENIEFFGGIYGLPRDLIADRKSALIE
ncbi:MAG: ATP-binding cassette domain-containing protein, partial [Calditrichaeota bacterium]|nr:ATP-binding cassette domain-containing protein [Calditrichota bacterium]